MIFLQAQPHFVLELRIQKHVSTSRIQALIIDERHTIRCHLDHALAEAALKDFRIFADDRMQNANERMQSVGGRADRREFGVITTDALAAVQSQIQFLAFVQFADQNIVEYRLRRIVFERLRLIADRYPLQMLCVDVAIHVEIFRQYAVLRRIWIFDALYFQFKNERVLRSTVQIVHCAVGEDEISN